MNTAQVRTARGCAIAAVAAFLVGIYLLFVELTGASAGQHATISELFWLVWSRQPWVILLVSHLVAAPVWYLAGHFTAQASSFYEQVRGGALSFAPPLQGGALSLVDANAAVLAPEPGRTRTWLKAYGAVIARELLHFTGVLARAEFEAWLQHERMAHFPAVPVPYGTTGPDVLREEPRK